MYTSHVKLKIYSINQSLSKSNPLINVKTHLNLRGHNFTEYGNFWKNLNKLDPKEVKQQLNSAPSTGITPELDKFLNNYRTLGIQGSELGKAINIVNKMLEWRLEDTEHDEDEMDIYDRRRTKIFLGFSSSMATNGTREIIRYLAENRMVDVMVTTTGGVEEDLIKCFGDYLSTDFLNNDDSKLALDGYERQGNILIPVEIQQKFKLWMLESLREIHDQQDLKNGIRASASTIIKFLGLKINHKDSILTQAAKNDLPIFCPAFTDGFIGEILFEYNRANPGLIIDGIQDISRMNRTSQRAQQTGVIILGGGIIKHHIMNANLMRNGAKYCVSILAF